MPEKGLGKRRWLSLLAVQGSCKMTPRSGKSEAAWAMRLSQHGGSRDPRRVGFLQDVRLKRLESSTLQKRQMLFFFARAGAPVGWLVGWWVGGWVGGWVVGRSVGLWLRGWLVGWPHPRHHQHHLDLGLPDGICWGLVYVREAFGWLTSS